MSHGGGHVGSGGHSGDGSHHHPVGGDVPPSERRAARSAGWVLGMSLVGIALIVVVILGLAH